MRKLAAPLALSDYLRAALRTLEQLLIPWGLGMVGVMALFARIVSRFFDTHYSIAYHAVIGIVLASTIIIIPTDFASTAEMVWGVACAILGAVLAYFGSKLQPQEDAEIEAK